MSRLLLAALTFVAVCSMPASAGDYARGAESEKPQARQGKEPAPALSPVERQQRLREWNQLWAEAQKLRREGKLAEAIAATEKMLVIERHVLGAEHEGMAGTLGYLAELAEQREDFASARRARRQALAVLCGCLGANHWRTIDARLALADVERMALLDRTQRERFRKAAQLNRQAINLGNRQEYWEASRLAIQVLGIIKEVLGEKHLTYATSLSNLALLYRNRGDYARAEPLYRQARNICKEVLGEKHPSYAASLDGLAWLYWAMGDYARAEPLYRQARGIYKEVLGEKHPDYAASLSNLALLYRSMSDYARAEPLCRQAGDIYKEVLGEKHPDYIASLSNLAGLYWAMGDYARAEPLFRLARDICKEVRGEMHSDYAASLNNLAVLYDNMGDYARAEPLYRQAGDIYKQVLGEKHPDYAVSLNNLATVYQRMGDYARAEPLCRQAQDIRKEVLGEKHPDYALSLHNLAWLYDNMGDSARAEPLYREALATTQLSLEQSASVQAERQQLAMGASLRYRLDAYLSFLVPARANQRLPDDASLAALYGHVLAWKGTVFMQQRRQHLARRHPELQNHFDQLQDVSCRLATRALAVPGRKQRDAWLREVASLTEKKERLEGALARRCADFDRDRRLASLSAADLQVVLPTDAVLLDILEYWHSRHSPRNKGKPLWERRVAAFVLRRGRPLILKDLGPVQDIADSIEAWRLAITRKGDGHSGNDPAGRLRRLLWQPLADAVGDAAVVLVSPDGMLGTFPFAALPGDKSDHYLNEERSVAVVAVPQLLPELLAADKADTNTEPSLLLVGDVDFGAAAGRADIRGASRGAARSSRSDALLRFGDLDATRGEMLAIADSFRRGYRRQKVRLTQLREDEATESAVRQQAPKHCFLHFATHGFFAPPELRSALAPAPARDKGPLAADMSGSALFSRQGVSGFHPGLLSGLALAGANRPAGADADDGILTALEVAAMDLSGVQLATLSACETGLGKSAGGEGLLGLQRAFQVGGARSVVASLWKVDDEWTRKLMERFYENLWQKKMGRLAALREAQRWVMREGPRRGLDLPEDEEPLRVAPPYYWAAFVLSGDWR